MTAAPHIFTLTGNLLAERTLDFTTWSPGRTLRALAESFQVGGKGLNVAKMLRRLDSPTTALCFTGGPAGIECESWLQARQFPFRSFATTASTRVGTVVRDLSLAQRETTFLGPDAAPDAAAIRACAEFLDAQSPACGNVLALCGSFPGWTSAEFDPLRAALARWQTHSSLVADTYGPPLGWAASQPLALIKVNADELRTFAPDLAHLPLTVAARRWVITDGPRAVTLRDFDGAHSALVPPHVQEVSATGSGDVLFACLLHALYAEKRSLHDSVAFALPYAAANAAHAGVAEFSLPLR